MDDKERIVKRLLDDRCDKCRKNLAEDYHTCPFKEEIDNDSKSLCNCCEERIQECADEI